MRISSVHAIRQLASGALLFACLGFMACAPVKPVIEADGPTYDGMVPVHDTGMKEAWVRPDINISSYLSLTNETGSCSSAS